jgi:hypothetical protein
MVGRWLVLGILSLPLGLLGGGCRDAEPVSLGSTEDRAPGSHPLVAPDRWLLAAADPFAALKTGPVDCPEAAWGVEDLSGEDALGVDTVDCGYLTVEQPSLEALHQGDTVALRLWHFELTGPEGAVSELGLALDGELVWREVLPIPREGELLTPSFIVGDDLPRGTPVHFHVSNHGSNSYNLIAVDLVITE